MNTQAQQMPQLSKRELYRQRKETARAILGGHINPSQKDWAQMEYAMLSAPTIMIENEQGRTIIDPKCDRALFERAYRYAADRLRIVGAGEAYTPPRYRQESLGL